MPEAGRIAMRRRMRQWQWRLLRVGQRIAGLQRTVYVDQRVAEYRGYWEAAARHVGAEFIVLTDGIWEVRRGGARLRLANYVVGVDDPVTLRLAGAKAFCYEVAQRAGLPVPPHVVCELASLDRAQEFLTEQGPPVVVKPASGTSSGIGVTTAIDSRGGLERAAALASLFGRDLLVEKMIPAESCRLLYLDGRLLHAVRRRGVRVTGDGRRSLRGLLEGAGWADLLRDPVSRATLASQGLRVETVPAAGREIVVRSLPLGERGTQELRTVYDEAITDLIHPALREAGAAVARGLGSRFAGVDVLTNDPGVPLEASGGVFLEINTTPGIHHHYVTPEDRRTHPVAVAVLESLLAARPSRSEESP